MAAQGLDQDTSTDLLGKALMAMSVSTAASGVLCLANLRRLGRRTTARGR
jgi:hypothetical protein